MIKIKFQKQLEIIIFINLPNMIVKTNQDPKLLQKKPQPKPQLKLHLNRIINS